VPRAVGEVQDDLYHVDLRKSVAHRRCRSSIGLQIIVSPLGGSGRFSRRHFHDSDLIGSIVRSLCSAKCQRSTCKAVITLSSGALSGGDAVPR
jgi:hypothetical protein